MTSESCCYSEVCKHFRDNDNGDCKIAEICKFVLKYDTDAPIKKKRRGRPPRITSVEPKVEDGRV